MLATLALAILPVRAEVTAPANGPITRIGEIRRLPREVATRNRAARPANRIPAFHESPGRPLKSKPVMTLLRSFKTTVWIAVAPEQRTPGVAVLIQNFKGTYPSTSWQPQGWISSLPWGVATRSADDRTEYLHALKPQPGRDLALPAPGDGKSFANARLLPCGKPVKLEQSATGLRLTLPDGEAWNPLDTVIAMDVTGKGSFKSRVFPADDPAVVFGTREVFNDHATQAGAAGWTEYHGNRPGQARDGGEYNSDIHYPATHGDAFTIHFNDTRVMMDMFRIYNPTGGNWKRP
jgi:hypothetical protein